MRTYAVWIFLTLTAVTASAQRTLMVERIGTLRRQLFHEGDAVKFRVSDRDTVLKGRLGQLGADRVSVEGMRTWTVKTDGIRSVYRKYSFPPKLGASLATAGAGYFLIIGINHLLNGEQVFTNDMAILTGSLIGAGGICFSIQQKRYRIGDRWKIKILEININ